MRTLEEIKFGFTSYAWHEVKYLMNYEFENLLSLNIHLTDYGTDVEHFIIAFLAIDEYDLYVLSKPQPTRFFSKNKEIIGDILLDFQAMMNAQSPEESRQIQAEGYLKFLDSLKHHRSLKKADFNAQKLYEDTKNLFEREGWVKKVEVKI